MDKWQFLVELIKSPVAVAIISLYFVYSLLTPITSAMPQLTGKLDVVISKLDMCVGRDKVAKGK